MVVRGSSSEFYGRREVYVNSMIPRTAVTVKILMPFTSFIDKRERKVQDGRHTRELHTGLHAASTVVEMNDLLYLPSSTSN